MTITVCSYARVKELLGEDESLKPEDMTQIIRYLIRHCEEQDNKMRMLKSELGRVARK